MTIGSSLEDQAGRIEAKVKRDRVVRGGNRGV